ncbi:predicted protein [Naegleria gruberi]|uniref:Predicted protein n=1 Tax=Naegleria gruberi TaxID=5762 RepID=D2VL45_NAEGR|nr:uncharacterized protein NAEGRDRAFT_69657 [Naegleria gruberi]EFC42477.1 predicted protein [Naegleria gruberi]|eukprot:XP_002675221.1 predicted protein [Naegleria gruberi strain NEG-M]
MALTDDEISSLVAFVICAVLLMAFIVIYVLFSSRIFAFVISKLLWYWKLKANNEYLSIGSLTFAPLGGKILFRGVQYTTKNGSLQIIDGYIEVYWWFIIKSTWQKTKKESRFRCYLNGVEWLIYNNVSRYDQINAKKLNYNLSDSEDEDNMQNDDRIHDTEDEGNRDIMEEDNIQRFFKWAKNVGVDVRRGCIAIGNSELPISLRIAFRRALATVGLEKPNSTLDKYKLKADINFEYFKIMFIENNNVPQYNTPHFELSRKKTEEDIIKEVQRQFKVIFKNSNFDFMNELKTMTTEKIDKEPEYVFNMKEASDKKSTIVDQKKVCLCTKLRVCYYYEEGGVTPEDESRSPNLMRSNDDNVRSNSEPSPVHGVELHFDRFVDGAVVYGPWGDHQRALLQAFFFPPLYENAKYYRKTAGRQRKSEKFDVEFYFNEKTTWVFPFIATPKTLREKKENKGDEQILTMIFDKNSFLHWSGDMYASLATNETITNIDFNFPGMSLITSNTQATFGESEIGKGHFIMRNSAEWNGRKDWTFNFEANKSTVYYTAEHIGFIMDLIRDWRNYPNQKQATLLDFIPSVYTYNFKLYNSMLKMHTNDLNIVEFPNDSSKNHFFCIDYPLMSISFTAPGEVFSPPSVEYSFSVEVKGDAQVDPGVHMEYPKDHPVHEMQMEPGKKFLWGERAHVHGTYTVHDKINVENVDSCIINVDLFNVNLMVNGYHLNYLITMWFDHFTAERFWMSESEYIANGYKNDKSKQISNLQSTDLSSIPYPSNPTEYFVTINIKRGIVHLPHSLYSREECTQLMGEEFTMDIRYVPSSIDLCFNLGQLMAEIPINPDEKVRPSKKFIGCEGIKFLAQLPIGPNPDGLLWRRKIHFDIGAITGEITPSQIGNIVNIGLNFVYQWKLAYFPKPDITFKKSDYSRRQYSSEEFDEYLIWDVRVTFVSISAVISMTNGMVNIDLDKGIDINFDSLNNGSSNSRLNVLVPSIHARIMNARETGMKVDGDWVQIGELLSGLKVGMEKKTHDLKEHYFRQQRFIQNMNGDSFGLNFSADKQMETSLNKREMETSASTSKKRSKKKNPSKRSVAKTTTEISETDISETDTDAEFFDIDDDELELEEEEEKVQKVRKVFNGLTFHDTELGKTISVDYIDSIISEDGSQFIEKDVLDDRAQWNLISKSSPSLSTYSSYLKNYYYEQERESLMPLTYNAKQFLTDRYPHHRMGMYSPFPEYHLRRNKNTEDSNELLPIVSKFSKLDMKDFRGQFYSFSSGKDRENIERILQIESNFTSQEKIDQQHINIEFLKNIDISFSPNVISLVHQLIKYIILPDSNLHATADHIEKSKKVFHQDVPEELLEEKKTIPKWDLKKIIFSGGVKCVNVNVLQSLSVPNIIPESPLQGTVSAYSIKLFATDFVASGSVTLRKVEEEKKVSSELFSIEGFGKCLEVGGISQCLDSKTYHYKGIDPSELPLYFLQRVNLIPDAPIVAAILVEDVHFQGKNNIKEENSQGRFTCTVGKQGSLGSGVSVLFTHDIIVISYSLVEVWRKVITDMVLNVRNYLRLRHVYDLLLLSQVSKKAVSNTSENLYGVLEKKQALKHLRASLYSLTFADCRSIQKFMHSHIGMEVDSKVEMRAIRNEYSELIEDEDHAPQIHTSKTSVRLRTDISFHLERLDLSVHSVDFKTKVYTKSIAKFNDILMRGKVEHSLNPLFETEYKKFESENAQKIRDISLILSVNCRAFSIDIHSQTLILLTSALGVFLIVKNKPFIKKLREKEKKNKNKNPQQNHGEIKEITHDVSASTHEPEGEKEIPVYQEKVVLKLNVFTNVNVQKATARAWMDKNSFAELSIDKFSLLFNQPKSSEEHMLAINNEENKSEKKSNLKMFNYTTPEKTNERTKEFISLFDVTVNDIRLNEFLFKEKDLNVHAYFAFDKLLINLPFADVWSASSVQFRLFVKTWYEAIKRKPNLPSFDISKDSSQPKQDQEQPKSPINFNIPAINIVLDLNDISAYFKLVDSFQMRYSLTKLTAHFKQNSKLDNNFMVHLFPHSFTLKSKNDEEFPNSNKWEGPRSTTLGSNEFRKIFILPEVIVSGSLENKDNNGTTQRILSTLIAIDYFENVVTSDLLNHVIVIQSAVTKEINKIIESLNKGVEDLEKIKNELPKAKKNVRSLNLFFDVKLLFEGIRITALGPSTALVVDSGSVNVTASNIEHVRVKMSLKGLNINMVDTHNIKWASTRKYNNRYSETSECYQWAQFQSNLQVQNFLDTKLSTTDKQSTKNFTLDISNTHLYLRPGCIEQALFLFKDYKQSVQTVFEKLKEARQKNRSEALTSLIKTGEEYYSLYSHQIKEKVASDASTFINSGVVRIMNTTLSMPFGDNPYFGFLTNEGPNFKPTCCLQVIIPAVGLSTMSESEDDVSATLDTLISTGKDSVSSQRVATCKVKSINIYLDEKPLKKSKYSFSMPTLHDFDQAKTKGKIEKIMMSLKLRVTTNEINGSGVIHVPGPDLNISPVIVRRALELGYDWFNPKRKIFNSYVESPKTQPQKQDQGVITPTKVRELTKRKIYFLITANIQPGVFNLVHNMTPNTLVRRKITDETAVAVEGKLPSVTVTALHKNPGTNTNRSTTHIQTGIHWDGVKLLPKSLFFVLEAVHEFKLWSKEEQKRRQNSATYKSKDQNTTEIEDTKEVFKPVAWMRMLKSVLLVQRIYRGFRARQLVKKLRSDKNLRSTYLKKTTKKEIKKKENASLQSDSFSLQCRINPFRVELSCFPLAETVTCFEFTSPFDIILSRTLRTVQTGNTKGTAIYLNVCLSCPIALIRCYHPLSPTPFVILTVAGIIGNLGSGFGNYLRSDDTPVYSGTLHVKKVSVEVSLPQMNHFFIMYTIWMDKYEEARKSLKIVRGDIKTTPKTQLVVLTNEEKEEKDQKRKKIIMEEISLESTSSKFGQLLISSFEIVSDMGPTLGKQKLYAEEISLFCKDKGRIVNEIEREPLHIGGYLGKFEGTFVGRLQGNISMNGIVVGLNRTFKKGGSSPTYKGSSEVFITALPTLIDLELNSAKILNISLNTLSITFCDIFDSTDGRQYHVETSVNSSGATVRLSKISASAFIYVFYKIKELATERKKAALDTLQGSVNFYNTEDASEKETEEEKSFEIKSLKIQSPTKQFLSLIPIGDIVFKGVNLKVYLYEKFTVEKDQFVPAGDWLEFGMDDYQLKFKRKGLMEDKSVERSLTLFLAKVALDRMTTPNKRSFILEVPGAHLTMNSLQTRSIPDVINYTFKTKFPKAITVTTNLNEYTFLQGLMKLYKSEVTNELEEHKKSVQQQSSSILKYPYLEFQRENSKVQFN